MTAKLFRTRSHFFLAASVAMAATAICPVVRQSCAQGETLILISRETSTRAVAVDSVTLKTEPFNPISEVHWGNDNHTRVMLFAMGLDRNVPAGEVTASAEDGEHNIYSLTVEYVGPVPEEDWATAVVVRLDDALHDAGDVLIGISYQGIKSNRVRVGIGHIGDGPPDDEGAVPTPGTNHATVQTAITAGTLTPSEVQTIIAQAVSAASSINHPVTVAVTDKEGTVLGVFKMTGATASTQFRGGGPGPTLVPNPITGFVSTGLDGTVVPSTLAAISKAGTAA